MLVCNPLKFLKNLRPTAYVALINFQEPTFNKDDGFDTDCGKTVFHLPERLLANQYLDFLRILVPPQILASPCFFGKVF